MFRAKFLATMTVLGVAALAAFAEDPAQKAGSAAPARPAACARDVRDYEFSPGSAGVADRMFKCFKARNQSAEAAAIFRRVAEKPRAPAVAWKYAGRAYDDAGLYPEAEAAYLKYLQKTPDVEARLALAGVYRSQKAYDKAIAQYRVVLSSRPKSSGAWAGIARTLFLQGQEEESLRYYDRAIAADPKDVEAQTGKAYALLWMDRVEESQALFGSLHERYPQNDSIARGFQQAQKAVQEKAVSAARRSGNTAALEAQYRQRLAQNPRDLNALRTLAELTAGPQRCAETVGYRRQAAEIAPADPTISIELARALVDCSQFDEAIARYRKVLEIQPESVTALIELGNTLRRAGRAAESAEVFQKALRVNPHSFDAQEGMARALVSLGKDDEALAHYNEALKISPDNYAALQGKAYLLYWTDKYAEARAIFQALAKREPGDAQNTEALQRIAAAEEEARWAAVRPAPNALPQEWLRYYEKRLASYPKDRDALRGWAAAQAQLKNYPQAIQGYRRVLQAYPDDHSSKVDLARLLSWEGQRDESIKLYEEAVKEKPTDTETLESLARVYKWADRLPEALQTYQKLLALEPSNLDYQLEIARLQLRLKDTPAAREFLTAVLAADPKNREAMLLLAQLNLNQSRYEVALKEYEQVLKQNPKDTEALSGQARMYYFLGDPDRAYKAASALLLLQPKNTDALFLMANIERVRGKRSEALALLDETLKISPNYREAQALRTRIREAGAVTLETSASYVREVGRAVLVPGQSQAIDEDLREYSYDATLGFSVLPRTDSWLSGALMPSETPFGGLRGTAGPSRFLYRQTTDLGRRWRIRSGIGLVRFGPGERVNLPGQPGEVTVSRAVSPLGLFGATFTPTKKLTLDAGWTRTHMAYTPTATRLAVINNNFSASADYDFRPRLHFSVEYYHGRFSTGRYDHTSLVDGQTVVARSSDHDQVHGGLIVFKANVHRSEHLSFDAGYRGNIYGHPNPSVFLGFYNPSFYQSHLFTSDFFGKLWGPLGYDFYSAIGVQQAKQENATRGTKLRPSFTLRASRLVTFHFGYSYYNTAEALSNLSGHSIYVSAAWTF